MFALAGAGARWRPALLWLTRAPVFAIRAHRSSTATSARNSVPTHPRQCACRGWPATSSASTCDAGARAPSSRCPGCASAVVRRVWPDRLAVRLEEHRAAALWEAPSERRRPPGQQLRRGVRGQRRRRRGRRAAARSPAPRAARPQMLALYQRLQPVLARAGAARRARCSCRAAARWRVELDSGAGDRARPRQRRRGASRAPSASCARCTQVTGALRRSRCESRRPAPRRRLRGAAARRHHRPPARRAAQDERTRTDAWPRNTRTWSSAWTSAPPR
ncbi:MAG: hypothetical protein MZW92_23365 [Comamonadaceae bacterium]|nr:hypothetical protein [Comamonadaceae bacterium]